MSVSLRLVLLLGAAAVVCQGAGENVSRRDASFKKHVRYYFFNKENAHQETGYQIKGELDKQDILSSGFSRLNQTKVIIPGYNAGVTDMNVKLIKDAYLATAEVNVIVVDWSYFKLGLAIQRGVAKRNAAVLDFMVRQGLLGLDQVHIVSLGVASHVAGMTGEHVTTGRVRRISGLDPFRPFINMKVRNGTLSDDDADLVDVVHTNAGTQGVQQALGHVDFYVNGGKKQPGCDFEFLGSCSHRRAAQLWAESIRNLSAFAAWLCEDEWDALHLRCEPSGVLAFMGDHLSYSRKGSYFLRTNGASPFSLEA